jgi:phospholipase/carboxylesterase
VRRLSARTANGSDQDIAFPAFVGQRRSVAALSDDTAIDDLTALLPALLDTLDALAFIARHLDPLKVADALAEVGAPDYTLKAARETLRPWPEHLAGLRARVATASDAAIAAFGELRAASDDPDSLRLVLRAFRKPPRALDAIYPLARGLPAISRFFLEPAVRNDARLMDMLASAPAADLGGVSHVGEKPGARGGFSLYVPENYDPARIWPLVVALHGGAGDGFSFLWNWLPAARAHGAILLAPTAIGRTWALAGEDVDTPNILRIVAFLREKLAIDSDRMLLTGMSDGGTFCYVSGLEAGSPFTHLAPVAAAFHPMLAEMADPARMRDLPIMLTHGAHDWMFPVAIARDAHRALSAAGAKVVYREIADLGHCYPREANAEVLAWLDTETRS